MPDPAPTTTTDPSSSLDLAGWAKLIPGVVDLINGIRGQGSNQGATAAAMADPYNKYRGDAADQLHTLVNDPSSIEKDPGFQYGLTHALDAGNRSSAAMGQGNAGNNILSQADIGQRYAQSAYDTKFGQLSKLAVGDPTAAAKDYLIGNTLDEQNLAGGVGSLSSFLDSPAGKALINSLGPAGAGLIKLIKGWSADAPGPAVDANGNPDPQGLNPPGGVDVNPNPNAVDSGYNPDPQGLNPPGGVDVNPNFDPNLDPFASTVPSDLADWAP